MAILPITVYGDKILNEKTKNVNGVDDELILIIRNMFDTMRNAGGIGLAANQVGISKSLFIVDLSPVEGYEDSKPIVLINPIITSESDENVIYEEGCLSLPNLRADVERPDAIQIKYINTDEKEVILEVDDWLSRVIQHEYDHLLGKLIPDRVDQKLKKMLQKELAQIMNREADINYPITEK
ncbi:MAG: peptide deformylase [Bacteroidetes bacterium]|nr:peptide deformylase [Bacteroidota bacterium]MBU1680645.1 peptide deformylase [Bacteroidota bacterium]MBU2506526.1 peptide deformylase [Bacteroidota bacterium]